jgi:2-amino-4-hydroxy-6-hydroxymethyldihydropteridine diphosphokinase
MNEVYLGIGGNLGNRLHNIEFAINLISERIAIPEKTSSVYMSEPWGFQHAKYFTNAVVMIRTSKSADEIFAITTGIELEMKRVRSKSGYQGRTMDIDILFYGSEIIETETLKIPHPKIQERLFVLLPMCEIAQSFIHPQLKKDMQQLKGDCEDTGRIRKLNKTKVQ